MTSKIFTQLCQQSGIPAPVPEYRFGAMASGGPGKGLRERLKASGLQDWRMDYAWPEERVALEVEGAVWTGGRHTRGAGFSEDLRKYNAAGSMGWIVLRCQPKELLRVATVEMVKAAMLHRCAG